jgi:hypothetical protein
MQIRVTIATPRPTDIINALQYLAKAAFPNDLQKLEVIQNYFSLRRWRLLVASGHFVVVITTFLLGHHSPPLRGAVILQGVWEHLVHLIQPYGSVTNASTPRTMNTITHIHFTETSVRLVIVVLWLFCGHVKDWLATHAKRLHAIRRQLKTAMSVAGYEAINQR